MTRRNRRGNIIVNTKPGIIQTKPVIPGEVGARLSKAKVYPRNGRISVRKATGPKLDQVPLILPGDRAAYWMRKNHDKTL